MRDDAMTPDEKLNAYLDGEMDEASRADFERLLETEPELRRRLALMRRIEDGLGRVFETDRDATAPEPVGGSGVDASARETPAPHMPRDAREALVLDPADAHTSSHPWWQVAAIAAVLALAGVATWLAVTRDRAVDGSEIYATLAANFEPEYICDSPAEFADYTRDAYGQAIAARFDSAVQLLGWCYPMDDYGAEKIRGPRALLARAPDGTPVVALFQLADKPAPELNPDAGLRSFERRIGRAVVHELTPLDAPVVLDLLSVEGS